ncbi:MAG: methyltransferase domain-containing protein [Patescibacteria group bacterium]|nr:methyltransferase domain-containing protein [Patescibacteria group bacterium]
MKLNLGCGTKIKKGYENFDCRPNKGVTKVGEILKVEKYYKPESFEYIICEHTIEHFYKKDAVKVLQACYNLLEPGGIFVVCGPDVLGIYNRYWVEQQDEVKVVLHLYGCEEHRELYGEQMMHKSGWTGRAMEKELKDIGFKILQTKQSNCHGRSNRDFEVIATK